MLNRIARKVGDSGRHLQRQRHGLAGVHQIGRLVTNKPVHDVGAAVTLRVGLADADVAAIRAAENINELVHVRLLLVDNRGVLVADLVLLIAQQAGHFGRLVEGALGIQSRPQRAVVDLLEVRVAGLQLRGRNIKRDRTRAQAQRIEVSIGAVDAALETAGSADQLIEFRHRGAVDDLHPAMIRVRVLVGQHGIASRPVEETTLCTARDPFVEPLIAGNAGLRIEFAVAELAPATGRIVFVTLTVHQTDDLLRTHRHIRGSGGKLPLVLVIDLDRLAQHRDILRRGGPGEVRMLQ